MEIHKEYMHLIKRKLKIDHLPSMGMQRSVLQFSQQLWQCWKWKKLEFHAISWCFLYSWVPNKCLTPPLLIFYFFPNSSPNAYLFFIIPNNFFSYLYRNWPSQYKDFNIKISVIKYEKNIWKTYEKGSMYW